MPRFVASAPSYVLALLVLSVVGAAASLYFVRLYLPMSVQEHYLGRAVVYTYSISPAEGAVYVRLFNPKSYRAKVDVLLVKSDGSVLTSCRGYVAGSRVANGSVSLMGIVVEPLEEVTVACFESGVRDVRVFDYGLGSPGTERVREGVLPGQATPVDHPIDIEPPWLPVRFRYRLPITVVTTTHRKSLCVAVTISSLTVGQRVFDLVNTVTKAKGEDILVASVTGYIHPTRVEKSSNSITVYFAAEDVPPGVHRYYLYFGNPYLSEPVSRMPDECVPQVSTPTAGLPWRYLSSEFSFPGYVVPEANWYPQDDDLMHGHIYITTVQQLRSLLSSITSASYTALMSIISSASGNRVPYPVGTPSAYSDLSPKTPYGRGSWGTLTVVHVASFSRSSVAFDVRTTLFVASDDGVSAYLVALDHRHGHATLVEYLNALSNTHPPRYFGLHDSIRWNYEVWKTVQRSTVEGRDVYLVILHHNGLVSSGGSTPAGWLDFRFVAVWVEALSTPQIGAHSWLHGWRYRKGLDITGSDWGPIDSYILRVTVHYGSGTDGWHNMYCNGKCRPDFGDIRFTSSDGRTLLPYCMITKKDWMEAVFYVRVQRPGPGEVARLYVYYGNSSARYVGNCTKVFGREVVHSYASDGFYDTVVLKEIAQVRHYTLLCAVDDDGSCRFDLPFRVRVYDTAVSCLHLSSNGFARWDCQPDSRRNNFVDTQNKILAPYWADLKEVYIGYRLGTDPVLGDYVDMVWTAFYVADIKCTSSISLTLYKNWVIEFNVGACFGGPINPSSFVSAGDGRNYIDMGPRWHYTMASVLFVPKFPSVYAGWGHEET